MQGGRQRKWHRLDGGKVEEDRGTGEWEKGEGVKGRQAQRRNEKGGGEPIQLPHSPSQRKLQIKSYNTINTS